ncbi:SusE domain-containing protein [Abyssalbus ytuae]|uniref:SusE domain-containing protein n=1 Tax=Abyssalbus ytuae TaxID=2926907 RepID=A0A9E7D0Q7_9FLAO|nr:SusE domain-containing protein [Abyssalbus ytuae]UOB18640.1 SusE domain-containing protein [Abyssalbus ytuae]
MKKLIFTLIAFTSLLGFYACDNEDYLVFTATPDAEGVEFTTSAASEYLLSDETEDNIIERFVWNEADFGAQTNVNYDLEGSISSTFDEKTVLAITSETNAAITVEQLLVFANELGLDNDPTTTDENGLPDNKGEVFVRVRAYAGTGTGNALEVYSSVQALPITVVEKIASEGCPSIYVLGAALADIGWNFLAESEILCENDVLQGKFAFTEGNFRFFEENGDWGSGLGYNYYSDLGYTIDAGFVSAGDGDDNFTFVGTPGVYTLTIDNINKEITLTTNSLWAVGYAVPGGFTFDETNTVELIEISPDVWQASIALTNDIFRFFSIFNDWDSGLNYPYFADKGYTIDPDFQVQSDGGADANFEFIGTPDTYTLTIDANNLTITLE